MRTKLENFKEVFSSHSSGCRRRCHCGKEYYDPDGVWDWEEGELEALEKNKRAIPLDYSPGDIFFNGSKYVDACECWHKRAIDFMSTLDEHAHEIAEYLSLEKKRKQEIADQSPVVKR